MCFRPKITIKDTQEAGDFKLMLDKHLVNYSVSAKIGKGWTFKIKGQATEAY